MGMLSKRSGTGTVLIDWQPGWPCYWERQAGRGVASSGTERTFSMMLLTSCLPATACGSVCGSTATRCCSMAMLTTLTLMSSTLGSKQDRAFAIR